MRKYTERLSFTLPAASKERLKLSARLRDISMSELIRRRVRQYMEFNVEPTVDTKR